MTLQETLIAALTEALCPVTKAFNPIATFGPMIITKAWEDNGTLYREGWISTNDRDRQKDITEPESFVNSIDDYFALSAPVSSNHNTDPYPIGHLQKGALVRDGKIFKTAIHPTDPAEFENQPTTGTGMYARLAITDEMAQAQVRKGNTGGFSFIGNATKFERLPGGGRRFLEINPLIETTIAAYPVNTKAVMNVAKAYGLQEEETMTPEQIAEIVAKAMQQAAPQQAAPVQKAETPALTLDQLQSLFSANNEAILKAIDERVEAQVQKAMPAHDRQGVGRAQAQQPSSPLDERDNDPVAYIIKKANSGEELDPVDRDFVAQLTLNALRQGLRSDEE